MDSTWWLYTGVVVLVFLFGLFGAYKSSKDKH